MGPLVVARIFNFTGVGEGCANVTIMFGRQPFSQGRIHIGNQACDIDQHHWCIKRVHHGCEQARGGYCCSHVHFNAPDGYRTVSCRSLIKPKL